jgi:hypothetical protein
MSSTRLAVELAARGWWYQRFLIEYRQTSRRVLGEELSLTEKQFKNWVHGRVRTRPYPKAAKTLEVMFPPWTVTELLAPPGDQAADVTGRRTQPISAPRCPDQNGVRPKVSAGGAADTCAAVPLLPTASGEYLDETYLASVHAHIRRVVELDNQFGGTELVPLAVRFFDSLHNKLGAGLYDRRLRSDLQAAAGELAEVVGWLAYDASQHHLVRRMNQESLFFTRLAGDKSMELLTLQNSSMHAAALGRPKEALHIVEAVFEGAYPEGYSGHFVEV